jgi:hypothetical protein
MMRMPRGQPLLRYTTAYLADFVFLVFLAVFFFAAFMLSTRLGYLRPAFLAAFFAFAFFAGDSLVDFLPVFFFGLGLSQGAFFAFFAIASPPLHNRQQEECAAVPYSAYSISTFASPLRIDVAGSDEVIVSLSCRIMAANLPHT